MNSIQNKKCMECGVEKPLEEFYQRTSKCKSCTSSYWKKYREENKEIIRVRKKQYREKDLDKTKRLAKASRLRNIKTEKNRHYKQYGISFEKFIEMKEIQNNCCAICNLPEKFTSSNPDKKIKELAVDHCHDTGKVRGLLCNNCNRALGLFQDNINILEKCIDYLKRNQ